jgi:hypothetical protein
MRLNSRQAAASLAECTRVRLAAWTGACTAKQFKWGGRGKADESGAKMQRQWYKGWRGHREAGAQAGVCTLQGGAGRKKERQTESHGEWRGRLCARGWQHLMVCMYQGAGGSHVAAPRPGGKRWRVRRPVWEPAALRQQSSPAQWCIRLPMAPCLEGSSKAGGQLQSSMLYLPSMTFFQRSMVLKCNAMLLRGA